MKRNINKLAFILLICSFFFQNAYSQSLEFVEQPQSFYSAKLDSSWDIYFTAQVKNISQNSINLKLRTEVVSLPSGHSYDVCWNGLCSPSTTTNWNNSSPYTLEAEAITPVSLFFSHYYSYYQSGTPTEGTGTIRYIFYNADNPDDNLSFDATFRFTTSSVFESISNSNLKVNFLDNNVLRIVVNNPSSMDYRITIYSLLGAKIEETQFNNYFEKDFSKYSSQVFLYQILQDGKIVGFGKIK